MLFVLIRVGGAMPLVEKWYCEHINKLVEREAFIDSVSSLEINFCSRFLRLSVLPWYWERLQVVSVTLKKFQGYVDE